MENNETTKDLRHKTCTKLVLLPPMDALLEFDVKDEIPQKVSTVLVPREQLCKVATINCIRFLVIVQFRH